MANFFFSSVIVYPVIAALAFAVAYMWSDSVLGWLHRRSLGQREEVLRLMELMFIETDRRRVTQLMLAISFGFGGLFFLAFWPNLWAGALIGGAVTIGGWSVPSAIAKSMWERRCSKFVDQMVDGMTIMANGIKSGLSTQQSMERVAENLANPISQEFGLVLSQMRIGRSLQDSLNDLGMRIPRPDVQMFVVSINILQETGGNLAETFQTINYTVRERQKIEKKIDALTQMARMQGTIISIVPFALLVVMTFVSPATMTPVFTTLVGTFMLMAILVLVVLGWYAIRKIAKIEV